MGALNRPESVGAFQTVKSRITRAAIGRALRFRVRPRASACATTMSAILSHLFRIPVNGKPITILDMSAVPSEVLNVVVSLICRMTFDFALWSEADDPDH